ncbi:hypothetical protein TGAM01_v200296 [Trichoderma gamsii]|uniref:Prp 6 CRoW domain-containing protein n=1 Tax=Trichoderma gamsii TaxID=398673 RepID=A0A2P5A2V2_9HYPO|nr:hypothetical protein TGAM01_v200296 [Trichoderma gamsii]PON30876.1 hypothetical protein TGAM01_v200296 [Trichoderma gamsii]
MRKSIHTHFTITNFLSLLTLSSIALAATDSISHKPHARLIAQFPSSSLFQGTSLQVAAAIEPCRPGELVCNDGCMPPRAYCCPDGDGYCKQGYSCVTDGCCPFGKICDGRVVCDFGEVPCGDKHCMPEGAVCCPEGSYCRAGETCFQNGFEHYCQHAGSATAKETKTNSIDKPTSSHDQSTTKGLASTRTSHEEASVPASTSKPTSTSASLATSSSEHETNKPIVLPTPHLSAESSTSSSVEAPSATSSSAPGPTTSPSNDNAATAVKVPGLGFTLALALVWMAVVGL